MPTRFDDIRRLALLGLVTWLGVAGCQLFGDVDRVVPDQGRCRPGVEVACGCPGGGMARQRCRDDGMFGPCQCGGADVGSDTERPADGSGADVRDGGTGGWPRYDANPAQLELAHAVAVSRKGGIFAHRLDGDELYDFVITGLGVVAAYGHDGSELWVARDEIRVRDPSETYTNSMEWHHPAAVAGDLDGDGTAEVAYLLTDETLVIRDGASGEREKVVDKPVWEGADFIAIADFRGGGDRDLAVQYDRRTVKGVGAIDGEELWTATEWLTVGSTPVRVVDLDRDGRDEVVGPILLDDDGSRMNDWDLERDRDSRLDLLSSLFVSQIVPDGPLEVALAEGKGNEETLVVNQASIVWGRSVTPRGTTGVCGESSGPSKLAVGNFYPDEPNREVFARSACGRHPWTLSSTGVLSSASATAAAGFATAAIETAWWTLFMKAVVAGLIVAGVVWVDYSLRDGIARITMVYIAFLAIPIGNLYHVVVSWTEMLYLVFEGDLALAVGVWEFVVPVLLGNSIGGVLLVTVVNYFQTTERRVAHLR